MLKQPIPTIFTRMIPEAFLGLYAICLLSRTKFNMKKILLSGVLGGFGVFFIRELPIHFGVHTILSLMLYLILAVKVNSVDIYKAIAINIVSFIVFFISDLILVMVYTKIFNLSPELMFGDTWISIISGIPSLIPYYILIRSLYYIDKKRFPYE